VLVRRQEGNEVKKQAPLPKKPSRPKKAAASKKKAPPKRAPARPAAAASPPADSEWAVGPYGDLVSKKDFAPSATRGGTR
jgi:hypothetical protein